MLAILLAFAPIRAHADSQVVEEAKVFIADCDLQTPADYTACIDDQTDFAKHYVLASYGDHVAQSWVALSLAGETNTTDAAGGLNLDPTVSCAWADVAASASRHTPSDTRLEDALCGHLSMRSIAASVLISTRLQSEIAARPTLKNR